MARVLSLQETIQRSQDLAKQAKVTPVQQLAGNQGLVTAPTTATGTSIIGGTPDQAKMAGTPAQKGAVIAQLGGESPLEQAAKLRGPSVATVDEEAKKKQAAGLAQAAGTFGAKATELVERTFQTITAQKAGEAGSPLQLKVDSAAQAVSKLSPTDQIALGQTLAQIGSLQQQLAAETDPAKKEALATQINNLVLNLNTKLGRDATTALQATDVTALVSSTAIPDAVKEAATAGMKAAIGDKLTLKDLGDLGTSPEELAALLKVDPATISDMSITDLENAFASLTQTGFGETQQVTAGMGSGLLSRAERMALRDVLTQMQETGVAGAELQVAQLGGQIADGKTVTIGGKQYTIEELMSTEEMTDIVKDVLDAPDGTFATSLKETEPEFYNWIISSKDGLQALLTGAGTAAQTFKTVQEENVKLLEPLSKHADFFKTLGFDTKALRSGTLKVTDLPPSAQAIFKLPPDVQSIAFGNLATLPPDQVKTLTADEVAKLGLDKTDGLWSKYRDEAAYRAKIAKIPDADVGGIAAALNWPSVDELNNALADAILVESMGGPRHPLLDLDVNKSGTFDTADVINLKIKSGSTNFQSLKDLVNIGTIPSASATIPDVRAPLNYGNPTTQAVTNIWRDQKISAEEANQLLAPEVSIDGLEAILKTGIMSRPGSESLRATIESAVRKKVDTIATDTMNARGFNTFNILAAVNNMAVFKEGNWDNIETSMNQARSAISELQALASREGNATLRAEYQRRAKLLTDAVNNKQAAIDKVGGRPAPEKKRKRQWWEL